MDDGAEEPIDGVEVGVTFEVPLEMHMLSFHKDHDFYIKHVPGKSTVPLLFSMSLPSPVRVPGCKLLCFATLLPSPLSACK